MNKRITSALISVYDKTGLEPIAKAMHRLDIIIYSTGGTEKYLKELGIPVVAVEDVTGYPSILGGRVKTLHPKVFGGILNRRDFPKDIAETAEYDIPPIDCVVVDLYPFEHTVASGAPHEEIIEKIDIGGISLIRAAAKNYNDVVIIPSQGQYPLLEEILVKNNGVADTNLRKRLSAAAFDVSSHYDSKIFQYLSDDDSEILKLSERNRTVLRYGENPHQRGYFYGNLESLFDKLNGKELSYNNLLDVDAAVNLIAEFDNSQATFAILKHNNACGVASRATTAEAYEAALACDPTSAFGGVLISNQEIDRETANALSNLFFEVLIAPQYTREALEILRAKANRIILKQKSAPLSGLQIRSVLNGYLTQDKDTKTETLEDLKQVTNNSCSAEKLNDLIFANKIAKHTKSNTIVLAKNAQLCASGTGQTSRIDALEQAIAKARHFGFDLKNAVMASDAFFPFPDCVEIAHKAGITAIVQPGGSIKDQLSIDYCNAHQLAMYLTGTRHFKH